MPTDSFDVDVSGDYEGIDVNAITADELDTAAVATMNGWQDNLLAVDSKNTSDTVNSITIDGLEEDPDTPRVIGSARIAALIGEFGRPPGAGHPPPDDLGDWVHEKIGLPNRGETVE